MEIIGFSIIVVFFIVLFLVTVRATSWREALVICLTAGAGGAFLIFAIKLAAG